MASLKVNALYSESSNRPQNNTGRRTSSSSITSESVKKAQKVYCAKQPKPRYYSAGVTLNGPGSSNHGKPSHNSSNSSSIASLRGDPACDQEADENPSSKPEPINENSNQLTNISNNHSRTMSLSPMKRSNNIKTSKSSNASSPNKGHQSLRNGGPKIAKPVIKPQLKIPTPNSIRTSAANSHKRLDQSAKKDNTYNKNSRLPMPPSSSSISSAAPSPSLTNASPSSTVGTYSKTKSPSMTISRIPQPGSGPSPLKKSRIPSAPKYNPPQRKLIEEVSRETIPTPSPPPPPPPSEMHQNEVKITNIAVGRCSPSSTPTPTPPESPQLIERSIGITEKLSVENEEEDDDILCVHPDGQVEIRPSSSSRASTSTPSTYPNRVSIQNKDAEDITKSQTNVSPWKPVPEPSSYQPPTYSSRKISGEKTQTKLKHDDIIAHEDSSGYSGGENASSADDEGSRDGEDDDDEGKRRRSLSSGTRFSKGSSSCPEKTDSSEMTDTLSSGSGTLPPRKTENGKQGIAARRIQRTWKHFYKEV